MPKKYVVVESDGSISWNSKAEAAESFDTLSSAERRARELAKGEPGLSVGVYQRISSVIVPVGAPVVTPEK